jgi:hypothetical protein
MTVTTNRFGRSLPTLGLGSMLGLDVEDLFESAFVTSRSNQAKAAKDLLPALSAFSASPEPSTSIEFQLILPFYVLGIEDAKGRSLRWKEWLMETVELSIRNLSFFFRSLFLELSTSFHGIIS